MVDIRKETIEEILENAVDILEDENDILLNTLAKRLLVTPIELTADLKKLQSMNLLKLKENRIVLSKKGIKLGRKMVRKHRLLERFLHDVLGLKKDSVHNEACELEHALSDEAERALCRFLDHPTQCPDDNRPIPPCKHKLVDCEQCGNGRGPLVPLTAIKAGNKAKVRFIRGAKGAVRRLRDMGIVPDSFVTMKRISPFGGPIELMVCGTKLALGRRIAEKVFVEAC